jgi:hypothetical protein
MFVLVFFVCRVGSGLCDWLITIQGIVAWCRITGCFDSFCGFFQSFQPKWRVMAAIASFQIHSISLFNDAM